MIQRSLVTAAILCLSYAGIISLFPSQIRRVGATTHQANLINVENVLYSSGPLENVIVGSSLSERLCETLPEAHFSSLAFSGGNAQTGLELIAANALRPKCVFVETNLITTAPNRELLGYFDNGSMDRLRRRIPLFRQSSQPINLLFSWIRSSRPRTEREVVAREFEVGLRHYHEVFAVTPPPPATLYKQMGNAQKLIAKMQDQGIKFVLVECPIDPSLANTSAYRAQMEGTKVCFPDDKFKWIRSDQGEKYTTTDGFHLTTSSANAFAKKLSQCASLEPQP